MYSFLRGRLASSTPNCCVIDTGHIGFQIFIATNTFAKLPQIGQETILHCSFIVRDNAHSLYGFLNEQERNLFELLITVSGIGPKIALSIIGHLAISELKQAVANNNLTLLCKIPGIGKKTAERLVIEIRDKVQAFLPPDPIQHATLSIGCQTMQDALSALINLGYNQNTAQKAVKKSLEVLPENPDLAVLITEALKNV
jgi:Holliday junction DNA helicase RuvA